MIPKQKWHIPPKKEFLAKFDRFEPIIQDHSAIIQAKDCFRKYFLGIVLGFKPKQDEHHLNWGSCYHKFREALTERWIEAGCPLDPTECQKAFQLALQDALDLWRRLKMRDPSDGHKFVFQTQGRFIESAAVTYKHWLRERQMGEIEVLESERNFILQLAPNIWIGGKADEIVRWRGKIWGRDFKTSSKEQNKWFTRMLDPNDQFTRYIFAESKLAGLPEGEYIDGLIVEVLYNAKSTKDKKKGPEIHTHLATRSQWQIERWRKEQIFYSKMLDVCRENDVYPMEESHCNYCIFHSVCKKGSEGGMAAKLQAEFTQRPWDCTDRGEVDA